ncbi:hypothetical protein [Legionella geestiana]
MAQLKQGTAPWQKPWKPGQPGCFYSHESHNGQTLQGHKCHSTDGRRP